MTVPTIDPMKKPSSLSLSDVKSLEPLLQAAQESVAEVGCDADGVTYPQAIRAFFREIATAPWRAPRQDSDTLRHVLRDTERATLAEVRGALTTINRSERYSAGSWAQHLANGSIHRLVKRARTVLAQRPRAATATATLAQAV